MTPEKKFVSADFTNLRVRAYMQTAIVSDQYLPLDGVLYYHMIRREFGPQEYAMPGESNEKVYSGMQLPIKKAGPKDDAWFYACSFAQWPEHTIEDEGFWVKRFDLGLSHMLDVEKKGKVELRKGRYKNYHVAVYSRVCLYVDWYMQAVKPEIEALLPFCTHLGKKTSQGYGSVLRWEVTDWPEDWSVRGPAGKLMRAVPILGNGLMYGVRPAYWHPHHIKPCKMP